MNTIRACQKQRLTSSILLALSFLLYVISSYHGNIHSFYINVYQFSLNPSLFVKDLYLNNTFFFDTTCIDDIVKALGFSFFDNDLSGFFVYLGLCLVSLVAVNLLLRDYFAVSDSRIRLILILMVIFFGHDKLLEYSEARFIYNHTGTPSFIAYQLKYVFLLFLLRGRMLLSIILMCALWAISFKHSWFLLPVSLLFHYYSGDWKSPKMAVYLLPLLYIIFRRAGLEIQGEPLALVTLGRQLGGEEDLLHLNQTVNLVGFALSFLAFPYLCKIVGDTRARACLKAIFVSTISAFFLGYLYCKWGWEFFPIAGLTSLSFIKAMGLYVTFFYLVLILAIFDLKSLSYAGKASLFVLVALWNVDYSPNDFMRYFRLTSLLVLLFWTIKACGCLRGRLVEMFETRFGKEAMVLTLSIFMLFTSVYYLRGAYLRWMPHWDASVESFQQTGKWSFHTNVSRDMVKALVSLRAHSPDMNLLAVEKDKDSGRHVYAPDASFLAMKSSFLGAGAHFFFNAELYEELRRREQLVHEVITALDAGVSVDKDVLSGLEEREVSIMVPEECDDLIKGERCAAKNGYVLIDVGS